VVVYVIHGSHNGSDIENKVRPCPGTGEKWLFGSVEAVSRAITDINAHRPRLQVRASTPYMVCMFFWSAPAPRCASLCEFWCCESGGPALKAATRVAASTPPPKHLDIFKGAPRRPPKPLSD